MNAIDRISSSLIKPPQVSLAQALDIAEQAGNLSPRRLRDLRSAATTLTRLLGRRPEDVAAEHQVLREHLAAVQHVRGGLSAKRFANVKSELNFLMTLIGKPSVRARDLPPMNTTWQAMFDRLPDRYSRTALSRFMKYCSALELEPTEVDDAVSNRYLQELTERSLIKQPRSIHQTVCRVWNKMADSTDAWTQVHLTVPDYRVLTYSLPWSAFPASLQADAETWLAKPGWMMTALIPVNGILLTLNAR